MFANFYKPPLPFFVLPSFFFFVAYREKSLLLPYERFADDNDNRDRFKRVLESIFGWMAGFACGFSFYFLSFFAGLVASVVVAIVANIS